MSTVTKPLLKDETGLRIVSALEDIRLAIDSESPDPVPVVLSITTPPTKTAYIIGEELDMTGLQVVIRYTNGRYFDVTDRCTFSILEGTPLVDTNITSVTISWVYEETAQTYRVSQDISVSVALWTTGSDEDVAKMLTSHYAGYIDIHDYWNVGDERTVHLSAMEATGVGESHVEQDVVMVLMNEGGKELVTAIGENTQCAFIVGQKNSLIESGYLNSTGTNAGGWDDTARRTWCNQVYKAAIPSALRGIFKEHKNVTGVGNMSESTTSNDYFALASEKEIKGSCVYSNSTAESSLSQFKYYETSANQIKQQYSSYYDRPIDSNYWSRSDVGYSSGYTSQFVRINSNGAPSSISADGTHGIAPFGVI